MNNNLNISDSFELIYVIVPYGKGSQVLHKAKELGIKGGTIFYGKGTISNPFIKLLGLYDERKEIVLMAENNKTTEKILKSLNNHFKFYKKNHGIVFSTIIFKIIGSKNCNCKENVMEVKNFMYQVIFTIVSRGQAEYVIEAAKEAGSNGGTIINARGSGIHENSRLFNMDIEPEKEIVMILAKKEMIDNISNKIRKNLNIDSSGNGIIFIQDVNYAFGIYE